MGAVSNNNIGGVSLNQFRGLLSPLREGKLGATKVNLVKHTFDWALVLFKRAIYAISHRTIMTDAKLFYSFNAHVWEDGKSTPFHVEFFNEFVQRNLALNSLTSECKMLYQANIDRLKKRNNPYADKFCRQAENLFKAGNNRLEEISFHPGFTPPDKKDTAYEEYIAKHGNVSWDFYQIASALAEETKEGLNPKDAFKKCLADSFRSFKEDAIKRSMDIHFKDCKEDFNTFRRLPELLQEIKQRYLHHLKAHPEKINDIIEESQSSTLMQNIMIHFSSSALLEDTYLLTDAIFESILLETNQPGNTFTNDEIKQILDGCKLNEKERKFFPNKYDDIECLIRFKMLQLMVTLVQNSSFPHNLKVLELNLKTKIDIGITSIKRTFSFKNNDFNSFSLHHVFAHSILIDDKPARFSESKFTYECPSLNKEKVKPQLNFESWKFNGRHPDQTLDIFIPTRLKLVH